MRAWPNPRKRACVFLLSAALAGLVGLASAAVAAPPGGKGQTLACGVGTAYVDAINAKNPQALRILWADNVDYTGPDGVKRDRAGIDELYDRGVKNRDWDSKIVSTSPFGDNGCLVEIWSDDTNTGNYTPAVIDRFEVNAAGKITRFNPFLAANTSKSARYLANMKKGEAPSPAK